MNWTLDQQTDTDDGVIRWRRFGSGGDPIVLVHGTPYSSFLWRDIAPALAQTRTVFVIDHLGYGESDKREGQDLTLAAQARRFVPQAAFYRQYRQLSEADTVDYEPHLAAVDVPVRLLWGREDRILPTPHGEWLRDHIPHESMHWIENAGHLLQEDSPAQLLSSIRG